MTDPGKHPQDQDRLWSPQIYLPDPGQQTGPDCDIPLHSQSPVDRCRPFPVNLAGLQSSHQFVYTPQKIFKDVCVQICFFIFWGPHIGVGSL